MNSTIGAKMEYPPSSSSLSTPLLPPLLNTLNVERLSYELQQGRGAARELHRHLLAAKLARDSDCARSAAEQVSADVDLFATIISSFSYCLSVFPASLDAQSNYTVGGDSNQGRKREQIESRNKKKQRDNTKKRKTGQSKIVETSDLTDDGQAWRKYGQKRIRCSPHPRNYYKCTYWKDQSCPAIKSVQKVSDKPSIYRTIYENEHACKSSYGASQLITMSDFSSSTEANQFDSCTYLSFGGMSSHQETTSGALTMNHHENYDYSGIKSNSAVFFTQSSSSSSSSSSSKPLQDMAKPLQYMAKPENLNNVIEILEMKGEARTDLMETVKVPMNQYDDDNKLHLSAIDFVTEILFDEPINHVGCYDKYYVGDTMSSEEDEFFPLVSRYYNYLNVQETAMSHDASGGRLFYSTYLGDDF